MGFAVGHRSAMDCRALRSTNSGRLQGPALCRNVISTTVPACPWSKRFNLSARPPSASGLHRGSDGARMPVATAAASADVATPSLPVVTPKEPWDPTRVSMIIAGLFEEHGGNKLHINMYGNDIYTTRDPKDMAYVLKHTDEFTKNPLARYRVQDWLGEKGLLFEPDVVVHAATRAVVQPAFRSENLKNHMASFGVTASRLVDIFLASEGEPLDIMELCKRTTADIFGWVGLQYKLGNLAIAMERLELPTVSLDDDEDLVADFDRVMVIAKLLLLGIPPEQIPDHDVYVEGTKQINLLVKRILETRRARNDWQTGDDILAFYLREQAAHGDLTDEEISHHVNTFLLAGEDTTAITLAFTFRSLAEHPEWQERVAAEVRHVLNKRSHLQLRHEELKGLPILMACINETLRIYPPAASIGRMCIKETNLNGVTIPKGSTVNLNIFSMHRNPEYWPRPLEWLPGRWLPEGKAELFSRVGPDAFQPFSTGSRSCIGRNFAYIEAQVVAAAIIDRLILVNVPERTIVVTEPFTLNSEGGVWIKALPRPDLD